MDSSRSSARRKSQPASILRAVFMCAGLLLSLGQVPSTAAGASYNRTLAHDMALLSLKAYGTLGPLVSFLGIPNFKVDITDTAYTLGKPYKQGTDFAFTASLSDLCVVAYRGTDNILGPDWLGNLGNLDFTWGAFRAKDGSVMAYTHNGFKSTYNAFRSNLDFISDIQTCLSKSPSTKLVVTGHSRGAALAVLTGIHFSKDASLDYDRNGNKRYDFSRLRQQNSASLLIYTYGEPRSLIGKEPSDSVSLSSIKNGITKFRFINERDLVPSVPPKLPFFDYEHWGVPFRLTDAGIVSVDENYPTNILTSLNLLDHIPDKYVQAY